VAETTLQCLPQGTAILDRALGSALSCLLLCSPPTSPYTTTGADPLFPKPSNTLEIFGGASLSCPAMDLFEDIAAMAAGEEKLVKLEDAVRVYEKDGVTRVLKQWTQSVACKL
jgi:hypothetical protein